MNAETLKRLSELHNAATPGKLETAEIKEQDWFNCPHCDGQGEVEAEQFINYDGVAANVLFSGIGHEFGANRDWYIAISREWPAVAADNIALQAEVERLREALSEIDTRHIPDQPAAYGGTELDWAIRQHTELRRIACAALNETPEPELQ